MRHIHIPGLLIAIAVGLTALAAPPAEARRVALVIGNADYRIAPLANPANDAVAVAEAFKRQLKFDKVLLRRNLGAEAFRAALLELARESAGAELGVVYFAGHGAEVGGKNFLIPVDATLARSSALALEAIPLDAVLEQLDGVSRLKLVILDACRNNIFSLAGAKRSYTRGLARIEPESNTLIAFAAKEGTTADDGKGRHSPYTAALLKHIATPGLEINLLFRRVRTDVLSATGGEQQPAEYHSLGDREIYLVPPLPKVTTSSLTPPPSQSLFAPQTFGQYLSTYPYPKTPDEIAAKIEVSKRIRTIFSTEVKAELVDPDAIGEFLKKFLGRHLILDDPGMKFRLNDTGATKEIEHEVFPVGSQRVLGKNVQIFVATSKPGGDWDCRACGVELSVFELINDFGRLELGSVALGLGTYGQWGGLDRRKVAVATIGPDRYGLLIEGGGAYPLGAIEVYESLVIPVAGTFLTVLSEMTLAVPPDFDGAPRMDGVEAALRFLPRDGYFFDIAVEKIVTARSGQKRREKMLFEFDNLKGNYVKAKPKRLD